MTTATKAKKAKAPKQPVTITAPKIANAWISFCKVSGENDVKSIESLLVIAKEMKLSQLTVREQQKVMEDTKKLSSVMPISSVEGLPTWHDMRKHKAFCALPLNKQISRATSAYKMLGSGNAQKIKTWEAVDKASKDESARRTKAKKANNASGSSKKAPKRSTVEALLEMNTWILSLDMEKFDDATHDAFAELFTTIESKADAFNSIDA